MAACTKIAAFGALLRLFYVGFGGAQRDWTPMIWIIAILTMAVGAFFALSQTDIKRMLAYSSIAHAGFVLVGFVGLQQATSGDAAISSIQAVLFYLVTYGFMTVGAFGVVTLVRDAGGEANHLSRWAGLGKESPVVAGVFAFFLLAMAGIPLTSGFTGKWAVFTSAARGGAWPLVVIAVLLSVVATFFYLRVIVVMYFSDPVGEGPTVAMPSILTAVVIAVGLAVTVVLGILPGPVLDLAANAGSFVR
jgi:NADH-quinone oxidoreductase subunit N